MAKSRLEPNKIVRYAESNIPKNGISTRPTPRIQASPAAAKAAVVDAIASPANPSGHPDNSPTPPPPPAPVVVAETRSFLFDGATELTGSAIALSDRSGRVVKMTVRPAWESGITGSWALLTLGTPNSNTYREEYKIENNLTYGPSFNTTLTYNSSASLSTADSASVNNDIGVDAADYTELKFNWIASHNENALNLFEVGNKNSPFQWITVPAYTRKENNFIIFVVKTVDLDGITGFKHRVRVSSYQKVKSQLTQTIVSQNGSYRYVKPISSNTVGSGDVLYIELRRKNFTINNLKVNGESISGGGYRAQYPLPILRNMTANDGISIGGLMSGSNGYFSGSIDQVAIFDTTARISSEKSAVDFTNESDLQIYYQFEGTTAASVGNDLQVVGTETYVSSSL